MKRSSLFLAALVFLLAAPQAGAVTKSKTFDVGPVTVGPYQVRYDYLPAPKPIGSGYITSMSVDIVDRTGPGAKQVPISRLMLHHIVFANVARRDGTCGRFTGFDSASSLPGAERFYGAGEERNRLVLPPGYGYRFEPGEPWVLTYMFMNHRNRTDKAYIRYTVTWETEPQTAVTPYWLDVKNCRADPVFSVPGGRKHGGSYRRSTTWTVPQSGRLVAGGGHVHGGAKNLVLRRQDCSGSGRIYKSRPLWGNPDHPFYNVRPILHEPGPISMSGFLSGKGVPVAKGERLALDANYDGELVHTRVMGIMMVYMAPDATVGAKCGALPSDLGDYQLQAPGRTRTPRFQVPIVGIRNGVAQTISRPPGRRRRRGDSATVKVSDDLIKRPNLSVARGATLRWDFLGPGLHNITVANGPRGFASKNLRAGNSYTKRLRKPGTYRLFCGLHPVTMTATIKVRKR